MGLRILEEKGNGYLFKKEWVEQYLEQQTFLKEKDMYLSSEKWSTF